MSRTRSSCSARLPRARGDGPCQGTSMLIVRPASPRSRGWTRSGPASRCARRGFPALAGMDPHASWGGGSRPRLPRARGDGPALPAVIPGIGWASPRSRGWTRGAGGGALPRLGFPALAGMDPGSGRGGLLMTRLPRARGDGPASGSDAPEREVASPRSRGWTHASLRAADAAPGFPALAGMDPSAPRTRRCWSRLPRARGDGPSTRRPVIELPAASPRSRGWTRHALDRSAAAAVAWTASPRSRGWTRLARAGGRMALGFPALAGMDPCTTAPAGSHPGLPRARGDGPVL